MRVLPWPLPDYREERRYLFDDMMATLERNGNKAALALVREIDIHTATGSFALIRACTAVIDRVFKAQGSIAVEEELEKLRRVVAEIRPAQRRPRHWLPRSRRRSARA